MAYNPKSCNALQKPFYRPVEAAIRWCELTEYEPQIMAALGDAIIPTVQQFPKWPCLEVNTQKIIDGIRFGEIAYGRNGNPVSDGEQVTPAKLTVRHNDLKSWMSKHYPDAKPPFLFDETERKTHSAINIESFTALQTEVLAAKAGEKRAEKLLCEHGKSFSKLNEEFNTLKSRNIVDPKNRTIV